MPAHVPTPHMPLIYVEGLSTTLLSFYDTDLLTPSADGQAAAHQKYIIAFIGLVLSRTGTIRSDISPALSPNCYRGK